MELTEKKPIYRAYITLDVCLLVPGADRDLAYSEAWAKATQIRKMIAGQKELKILDVNTVKVDAFPEIGGDNDKK
jgi:hypothetical protein